MLTLGELVAKYVMHDRPGWTPELPDAFQLVLDRFSRYTLRMMFGKLHKSKPFRSTLYGGDDLAFVAGDAFETTPTKSLYVAALRARGAPETAIQAALAVEAQAMRKGEGA